MINHRDKVTFTDMTEDDDKKRGVRKYRSEIIWRLDHEVDEKRLYNDPLFIEYLKDENRFVLLMEIYRPVMDRVAEIRMDLDRPELRDNSDLAAVRAKLSNLISELSNA